MRIISFSWTAPALQAYRKTCTRRNWETSYAEKLQEGELLQAWDHSPRTGKGSRIGTIRLTCKPYLERISLMPDEDYENEGFAFFEENPNLLPRRSGPVGVSFRWFQEWRAEDIALYVVRFEVEELF